MLEFINKNWLSSKCLKTVIELAMTASAGSAFQQSMPRQANEKALALLFFLQILQV